MKFFYEKSVCTDTANWKKDKTLSQCVENSLITKLVNGTETILKKSAFTVRNDQLILLSKLLTYKNFYADFNTLANPERKYMLQTADLNRKTFLGMLSKTSNTNLFYTLNVLNFKQRTNLFQ